MDDAHLRVARRGRLQVVLVDLVRNNGGGHANHSMFWQLLAPSSGVGGDEDLGEDLAEAITWGFESLESLKEQLTAAAAPGALFGSG